MPFLSFSFIFLTFFASSLNAVCTPEEYLKSQFPAYGLLERASKVPERDKNKCHEELSRIKQGIDNLDRWAVKVLDASGVPSSGVHWGAQNWLGSKFQCLTSTSTERVPVSSAVGPVTVETEATVTPFPVAYFAAYFTHNSSIMIPAHYVNERRITLGLCLPYSCDAEEVGLLLQDYFDNGHLYFQHVYDTKFEFEGIKKIDDDDFSWLDAPRFQLFIKVISAVFGLCVLGTVYDVFFYRTRKIEHSKKKIIQNGHDKNIQNGHLSQTHEEASLLLKIIRNFSFSRTSEIIFNTNAKEGAILCIHGLRVVNVIFIITNHFTYYTGNYMDNRIYYYIMSARFAPLVNSAILVEGFFTMSGFLLSYIFLNMNIGKDKTLKQKFMMMPLGILKRYFRIVPAYLFTILLTDMAESWRQKSSVFSTEERNDLVCQKYWWRNLLFINNFYPRNEMCLSWSWYLSCDMQCYILGCVILILSTERFKLAVGIILSILLANMVTTGIIVYKLDYIPFLDFQYATMEILYDNTFLRIGPFLVGLLIGMILHKTGLQITLNKPTVTFGWILAILFIFGNMFVYGDRFLMTLTDSIIFMVFSKITLSLGVCWVIFACATGYGGSCNKFLSAKFWMPLSRLTFGVTLLNPLVIYFINSFSEKGSNLVIQTSLVAGIGHVVVCFISSIFLSMMFEWPFQLTLDTIFEKKGVKVVKSQTKDKKIS